MRTQPLTFLLFTLLAVSPTLCVGQAAAAPQQADAGKPEDTEVWYPVPKVVTPGANNTAAPSDAIVLFDGKNLDEWVSVQDKSPAKWTVGGDVLTVNKAAGNI